MPDPHSKQIAQLLEKLDRGLFPENLLALTKECSRLAQDSPHTLAFYVVGKVFGDVAATMAGETPTVDRCEALTDGIAEMATTILRQLAENGECSSTDLNELVASYYRNSAVSKA